MLVPAQQKKPAMRDETQIAISDESQVAWCAHIMASTDPWLAYKFSEEKCSVILRWAGSTLFIASVNEPVGFVLLHPRGFLGCPYIAVAAVVPSLRSRGIGAHLLQFAESHMAVAGMFTCASLLSTHGL